MITDSHNFLLFFIAEFSDELYLTFITEVRK